VRYEGGCHCGAIRLTFETDRPLAPRACQCRFCRKHGARSVSDPGGAARLLFRLPPIRYRFASKAADYLICSACGVYVGATTGDGDAALITLNLNTFDDPHPELEAAPVAYDDETPEGKAERRRQRWTPVRFDGS
jgi:hypothetical protein